jgi:hypothetical protein
LNQQLPDSPSKPPNPRIRTTRTARRRAGEKFIVGSLLGLALALVLSGAANIALVRDAACREAYMTSRRAFQQHSCLSQASIWEVTAIARGPAAASDPEAAGFASWAVVPIVYALIGGFLAQLSTRNALIGALVSQLFIFILLAAMAFLYLYVA